MITQMNSCQIEYENDFGEIVVKASRADTNSAWHFGALIDGKMVNLGELYPHGPEVLRRKLILAIIYRLVDDRDDCNRRG